MEFLEVQPASKLFQRGSKSISNQLLLRVADQNSCKRQDALTADRSVLQICHLFLKKLNHLKMLLLRKFSVGILASSLGDEEELV